MMNDVFSPDAFSLTTLTAAINEVAFTPTQIAQLGIFEEDGIATLDAAIEFQAGTVSLVDIAARGAPGQRPVHDKRRIYSFRVPHLPQADGLLADSVQGIRAFGQDTSTQAIEAKRDQLLAKMRRQIDYTIEAHRMAALKGGFYDANGVLVDLFAQYGLSQTSIAFLLTTATTKVRQKCQKVLEAIEAALDGVPYTGVTALCGKTFWTELIDHELVRDTYQAQNAAQLRANPFTDLDYGDIVFRRYRGDSSVKVADDEAIAFPTGVPEFCITRFAPANYIETVNTIGLPYYAKAEAMPMGKGMNIESQANPLNMCTRPAGLIKLTKT